MLRCVGFYSLGPDSVSGSFFAVVLGNNSVCRDPPGAEEASTKVKRSVEDSATSEKNELLQCGKQSTKTRNENNYLNPNQFTESIVYLL